MKSKYHLREVYTAPCIYRLTFCNVHIFESNSQKTGSCKLVKQIMIMSAQICPLAMSFEFWASIIYNTGDCAVRGSLQSLSSDCMQACLEYGLHK